MPSLFFEIILVVWWLASGPMVPSFLHDDPKLRNLFVVLWGLAAVAILHFVGGNRFA